MNSKNEIDLDYDLTKEEEDDFLGKGIPKSNEKLFKILGIVGGIALIITIILLAVLIPRGKKETNGTKDTNEAPQTNFY